MGSLSSVFQDRNPTTAFKGGLSASLTGGLSTPYLAKKQIDGRPVDSGTVAPIGSIDPATGKTVRDKRNSPADNARLDEEERQAGIAKSIQGINSAFDSPERQKQYGDYISALRGFYGQDAERQKVIADRNLKFSNAKAGLTGGSSAVDSGHLLGDEYKRGLLTSENQAQSSLAGLMSQDQSARLNLTSLARSGLDATTAASNAANSMKTNIAAAQSGAEAKGLGDIFGGTADVYKKQATAAQFRAGQQAPLGSYYGRPFGGT